MKTLAFFFVAFIALSGSFSRSVAEEPAGNNLHRFEENRVWGFKDEKGNIVIRPEYDDAWDFSSGLAPVNYGAKLQHAGFREGGIWGYINIRGEVVIPFAFREAYPFSEDLARIKNELGKTRFIDLKGKTVFEIEAVWAGDFHEGLACVHIKNQTKYLDKKGNTSLTVDGEGGDFHDGLASLGVMMEGKKGRVYGYIDKEGKQVLKPRFLAAERFGEGLAAVRINHRINPDLALDESWGYIDKSGEFVIKPQFNEANPFIKGKAWVHVGGAYVVTSGPRGWAGGEWLRIDEKGNILERKKGSIP